MFKPAKKIIKEAILVANACSYKSFVNYATYKGVDKWNLYGYMWRHPKKFISLGRGYFYCPNLCTSPQVFLLNDTCMYIFNYDAMKVELERIQNFVNKAKETLKF